MYIITLAVIIKQLAPLYNQTNRLAEMQENQHFCLAALAIENGPLPTMQGFECQAQQFQSDDRHGRAALQQVSGQNLQNGVGVLLYTKSDGEGRQRYEGQLKNALPGEFNKRINILLIKYFS